MRIEWDEIRFDGSRPFRASNAETSVSPLYDDEKDYKQKIRKLRQRIDKRQRIMYAHDR